MKSYGNWYLLDKLIIYDKNKFSSKFFIYSSNPEPEDCTVKFETSYIESEACHNNNNNNKEVLIKPGRLDGGKKDILHTTSKPISKLKASKTPSLNPENHFMSL